LGLRVHFLLIHQAFAGTGDAGGTRHYELARCLAADGHRFTVVTSNLSYLTGRPRKTERYIGPEGWEDSVRVVRTWTLNALHRSFVWRVAAFLSFMVSSVVASLRVRNVDLVIGTSPPIFQAVAAWVVSVLKRVPFILEVRDLWPEFAIDMGVLSNPTLIRFSRWLEGFLYSRATQIIVNSPAYEKYLLERGVPEAKITVVPNGVDPSMFDTEEDGREYRRELAFGPQVFIATYAGALGMANDIPTILRAAKLLEGRGDIKFVLVGDGKERPNLEGMAAKMELSNVVFPGSVAKARMPGVLAASDACLATLMNIPMFKTTYPNKVFDYMAAARPTVLGIDGVIREVVESAGGGIFVPPGDPEALAEAVTRLADDRQAAREMGQRARAYVEQHFDRRQQSALFATVLERAAGAAG
jgi:glycosyltransferase involved in cell wall biosynthesis